MCRRRGASHVGTGVPRRCSPARSPSYLVGDSCCCGRGGRFGLVFALACAIQLAPLAAPVLLSTDALTVLELRAPARSRTARRRADDRVSASHAGRAYLHTTSAYGPAFSLLLEARRPDASPSVAGVDVPCSRPRSPCSLATWLASRRRAFCGGSRRLEPDRRRSLRRRWAQRRADGRARRRRRSRSATAARPGSQASPGRSPYSSSGCRCSCCRCVRSRRARPAGASTISRSRSPHSSRSGSRPPCGGCTGCTRLRRSRTTCSGGRRTRCRRRLHLPTWLFVAAYAIAYGWLLVQAARGRARLGLAWALLLLCLPYLIVWYVLWPLVAPGVRRRSRRGGPHARALRVPAAADDHVSRPSSSVAPLPPADVASRPALRRRWRPPAAIDARSVSSPASRSIAAASSAGSRAGTSSADSPSRRSSRAASVSRGDHRRARRERSEDGGRDRRATRRNEPEHDPGVREREPARVGRELSACSTTADRARRRTSSAAAGDDVARGVDLVQRRERVRRRPRLAEDVLVGAEEHDRRLLGSERAQVGGLRLGAADDEVGQPQRACVRDAEHVRRRRARAKVPPHGDELVLEREHRVEDERPGAGEAPGPRHVEVARIPDDQRVGSACGRASSRRSSASEHVQRPAQAAAPELRLALDDFDAGVPKRGDRVHVARMLAVVRPEVEDLHEQSRQRARDYRDRLVKTLLGIDEALGARARGASAGSRHETVPLARRAGRVLAEAVQAAVDLPPFDSSAMDGFAVRAADTPGRPGRRRRLPPPAARSRGVVAGGRGGRDLDRRGRARTAPTRSSRSRARRPRCERSTRRARCRRATTCGRAAATSRRATSSPRPERGSAPLGDRRTGRGRARAVRRLRAAAAGGAARDGQRAAGARRAARARGDLRGELRCCSRRSSPRRAPRSRCSIRWQTTSRPRARRSNAGSSGRRARDLGRRLGRPARPRARSAGGARCRGGLLARRGEARASRSSFGVRGRDARVRPAGQPRLVARRFRALRAPGAARAAGRGAIPGRAGSPAGSPRASGATGNATSWSGRGSASDGDVVVLEPVAGAGVAHDRARCRRRRARARRRAAKASWRPDLRSATSRRVAPRPGLARGSRRCGRARAPGRARAARRGAGTARSGRRRRPRAAPRTPRRRA